MLFEYVPQNEDELELKLGDVIDITEEVSCSTELIVSLRGQKSTWFFSWLFELQGCWKNSVGSVFEAKADGLGVLSLRI